MTDWITDRLPTEADADIDGDVVVNDEYLPWNKVQLGQPWRHSSYYEDVDVQVFDTESIKANGIKSWITTRQPLASDGNKDGAVHVRKYPDREWGVNIHWSYVGTGVPWEHTKDFEGLIEPIPPEPTYDYGAAEEVPMFVPEDVIASIRVEEPILYDGTDDGPWDDVPHNVRTFVSVRRTRIDEGWALDAVASDGTAWCRIQRPGTDVKWQRLPDLPQD